LAGVLVAVDAGDRDDLTLEAALVARPGGPGLALGPEGVEVLAGQVPLVGDQLGRDALRHEAADVRVAQADAGAEREPEAAVADRGAHRHLAHDLDAG